ncbi:peptidyl-prolyl cis-trans isomerase CYP65 [Micractinium conductrix]|uniref:Peptidyl-prolyl cis-trans isomerase CYP65 n=1 Tax=Micractinium conductrix TaxID=554055 RepID=A0A2P6VKU1_9CHLO|nr:peptidyl-prolyl cis-trans isomerase CYP65 [Micractinium conductrix]|eukprot:PSC74703.1 peptidyl-prolyl cis-trans isomerase CYP65 [Micractinium conductrix]
MGKKRAQKDRAYLTATEWREEHGGFKGNRSGPSFKRLPFTHCAISFQPFDDAVCTADGSACMDIVNAVPYIQKFHKHPVSGAPLELKDLIRLHFHKNADGEYHCPVLNKVFTEHTHIVAIKPTGNVYCWEAVEELCVKPKNLRDLLTDEPFTRKDIIHLQDPLNLAGRNLAEFDHVKKGLEADADARAAEEADPMFYLKGATEDTKRALDALNSKEAEAAFAAGGGGKKAQAERLLADAKAAAAAKGKGGDGKAAAAAAAKPAAGMPDPRLRSAPRQEVNASFRPGTSTWNTDEPDAPGTAPAGPSAGKKENLSAGRKVPPPYSIKTEESFQTTGAASRAFTSTAMAPVLKNERTMRVIQLQPTAKGYLRLHTTLGDINVELHCDVCPRTCENFLALAESGYYDNTVFHRSIKNFMIQGGDPTGTGKGGESVFGPTFKDELDSRLLHNGRGILSMANSGKDTNGSQFFILYKSAHHLDYKHTVFGRVVGGFEVLTLMEKVPTDEDDRPVQEIKITGATIFVNPYTELLEQEAKAEETKRKQAEKAEQGYANDDEFGKWWSNPAAAAGGGGAAGVGRYLSGAAPKTGGGGGGGGDGAAAGLAVIEQLQQPAKKAKTAPGSSYGNFDGCLKDVRSARVLLEAGADPNAGGSSSTPMCFLRGGRQGLVAPATRQLLGLLLRHGADCLRIEGHSLYSFLWHFVNSGLGTSLLAHLERQRAAGTLQLASVATALQLLDGAITAGHLPLFSHALAALQGLAAAPGGQPTAAGGRAGAQQLQLAPPEFYVFRNTLLAAVHSAHASAPQIARTLLSCQLALDLARQQPRCLPDLLVEVLRCSRRMREAALPLLAAAGVSPRDALLAATHGDVEPDALAALLALGSPAVDTSAVTAEVGRHASYSCLIHRLLHLGNVPHVWSGGDDCLRWEAVQRWEQMRRLELLLEAGCRPTVWHNVAPPAFLGRGDAPLPVLDPFDFHEQGVVDSRLGFIARGGTWSLATHHRWPEAFKAAARTLLLAASSAGAQAAAERHGGGAAAECAAKRRRRQRQLRTACETSAAAGWRRCPAAR